MFNRYKNKKMQLARLSGGSQSLNVKTILKDVREKTHLINMCGRYYSFGSLYAGEGL
jgi:hypothetical protein